MAQRLVCLGGRYLRSSRAMQTRTTSQVRGARWGSSPAASPLSTSPGRAATHTGTAFSRSGGGLVKVDLCDSDAVAALIRDLRPHAIVHAAAERRPDVCEGDATATTALNGEPRGGIALCAALCAVLCAPPPRGAHFLEHATRGAGPQCPRPRRLGVWQRRSARGSSTFRPTTCSTALHPRTHPSPSPTR